MEIKVEIEAREKESNRNRNHNHNDWILKSRDSWNEITMLLNFFDLIAISKTCLFFKNTIRNREFLTRWINAKGLKEKFDTKESDVKTIIENLENYFFTLENTTYQLTPLDIFGIKDYSEKDKRHVEKRVKYDENNSSFVKSHICFHDKEPYFLTYTQFGESTKTLCSLYHKKTLIHRFTKPSSFIPRNGKATRSTIEGYLFAIFEANNFYTIAAISTKDPKNSLYLQIPFHSFSAVLHTCGQVVYFLQKKNDWNYFWFFTIHDFTKKNSKKLFEKPTIVYNSRNSRDWSQGNHFFYQPPSTICYKTDTCESQFKLCWIYWNKEIKKFQEGEIICPGKIDLEYKLIAMEGRDDLIGIFSEKKCFISKKKIDSTRVLDLTTDKFCEPIEWKKDLHSGYYLFFKDGILEYHYEKRSIQSIISKNKKDNVWKRKFVDEFRSGDIIYILEQNLTKSERIICFFNAKEMIQIDMNNLDWEDYFSKHFKICATEISIVSISPTICLVKNENNQLCFMDFIPTRKLR